MPSTKAEEFRILKENAIKNQDFEVAAKYRDQEREENKKT